MKTPKCRLCGEEHWGPCARFKREEQRPKFAAEKVIANDPEDYLTIGDVQQQIFEDREAKWKSMEADRAAHRARYREAQSKLAKILGKTAVKPKSGFGRRHDWEKIK